MSTLQTQSVSQEKFLLLAANLLHKALVAATRTEAKSVYSQLVAGKFVALATVQLADNASAGFHLSLAHGEFQGRLNYGAFRASVLVLIDNITRSLRERKAIRVFNALNGGSAMIFGITAFTQDDRQPNVMVLAADMGRDGQATTLQLMYLDPAQFTSGGNAAQAERSS